jgi:hypothetical protein
MAFVHGRGTVVIINGVDISAFTNNTEDADVHDAHDVSCYGADRKGWAYGLGDGKITISGIHDDTSVGPRKVLKALKNNRTIAPFIFRPSGTGVGKQQTSVNVLVETYTDTSPIAGMITWKSVLQMSGTLTETDQ